MQTTHVERHRDRREMAREAGFGSISGVSVLAGTLAAYGLAAALLAGAGGVAVLIHGSSNFSGLATGDLKVGTGVVVAGALFLSYLFGGYVAGRMARRSGLLNGLGVFILGVILAVGIGVWVKEAGGGPNLASTLRHWGAPTTWHEWRTVGSIAGVVTLVAMFIGSLVGGVDGERWHGKLARRAMDPTIGPDASVRSERPVEREAPISERPVGREAPVVEERPVEREAPVSERPVEREEPVIEERSPGRRPWAHLLHH